MTLGLEVLVHEVIAEHRHDLKDTFLHQLHKTGLNIGFGRLYSRTTAAFIFPLASFTGFRFNSIKALNVLLTTVHGLVGVLDQLDLPTHI